MEWDKLFKKYVADEVKTPYLVSVDRLTRTQARYELFIYTLFLGVLFAVVGIASLSDDLPHGRALGVPLNAFAMVWAAGLFGVTKATYAATFCASAPVAALLYLVVFGFHPNLGPFDKVLLIGVILIWLRYSWRILMIAKAFPDMPDPQEPS